MQGTDAIVLYALFSYVSASYNIVPAGAGSRLINGDPAELGQFPWQVALNVRAGSGGWFCSGAIISQEWVVSTARCLQSSSVFAFVWAGMVKFFESQPVTNATRFYQHSGFNETAFRNDIALARLDSALTFSDNLRTIKLAFAEVGADVEITVSGWGETVTGGGIINLLTYINLNTISNSQCERIYGAANVVPGMLCAVSNTNSVKSPCSGDSGDPGVMHANTNPTLVALVSWISNDGCESSLPSGYTRVYNYKTWIEEVTGLEM